MLSNRWWAEFVLGHFYQKHVDEPSSSQGTEGVKVCGIKTRVTVQVMSSVRYLLWLQAVIRHINFVHYRRFERILSDVLSVIYLFPKNLALTIVGGTGFFFFYCCFRTKLIWTKMCSMLLMLRLRFRKETCFSTENIRVDVGLLQSCKRLQWWKLSQWYCQCHVPEATLRKFSEAKKN